MHRSTPSDPGKSSIHDGVRRPPKIHRLGHGPSGSQPPVPYPPNGHLALFPWSAWTGMPGGKSMSINIAIEQAGIAMLSDEMLSLRRHSTRMTPRQKWRRVTHHLQLGTCGFWRYGRSTAPHHQPDGDQRHPYPPNAGDFPPTAQDQETELLYAEADDGHKRRHRGHPHRFYCPGDR